MLRRINAALFEAPAGARIEVVAKAQNNNGVNDARFEYAGNILDREQIISLPGCHFTVEESRERLQAVVAFDDSAPATARYDLFEVENGATSSLNKFVLKSDGSPLIDFSIDPIAVAVPAGAPGLGFAARKQPARQVPTAAGKRAAAKRATVKKARPAAKPKAVKKASTRKRKEARKTSKPRRAGSRNRR